MRSCIEARLPCDLIVDRRNVFCRLQTSAKASPSSGKGADRSPLATLLLFQSGIDIGPVAMTPGAELPGKPVRSIATVHKTLRGRLAENIVVRHSASSDVGGFLFCYIAKLRFKQGIL